MRFQKNGSYYSFLAIPVISTLIFISVVIVPFIIGLGYSFYQWNGIVAQPKIWVWLDNYMYIFSDTRFWQSGINTVVFTVFSAIFSNLLGLILALVVSSSSSIRNKTRVIFFVPYLIGGLILGFIWKFIFAKPFPSLGEITGLEQIFFNWILLPKSAMTALILVNTWKMAGYIMIIFITGLKGISEEVIEAACVDGANKWQLFRYIKIPLLRPAITITTFMTLSNAFKLYDVNVALTNGGPFNSTEVFSLNIYREIFTNGNYGYGQAKAILFFVFIALITLIQTNINKRKEVEM